MTQSAATSERDVTVVMTSHAEGEILIPTLASHERMRLHARSNGISARLILVMDRATADSKAAYRAAVDRGVVDETHIRVMETDFGSGALARNAGVAESDATFIAVADNDNLYSENWLTRGVETALELGPHAIVHPDLVCNFDESNSLWPMWSSRHPVIRPWMLVERNYWDAACLARREAFVENPYHLAGPAMGLGPGDWWWNLDMLAAGYTHEIAMDTMFYYRVKTAGSGNIALRDANALIGPTPFLRSEQVGAAAMEALSRPFEAWPHFISQAHATRVVSSAMLQDWERTREIEPLVPAPSLDFLGSSNHMWLGLYGRTSYMAIAFWAIMLQLPGQFDAVALVGAQEAEGVVGRIVEGRASGDRPRIAVLVVDPATVSIAPRDECEVVVVPLHDVLQGTAQAGESVQKLLTHAIVQLGAAEAWIGAHPLAEDTLATHSRTLNSVTAVKRAGAQGTP